jgi:WD40 repeat protein
MKDQKISPAVLQSSNSTSLVKTSAMVSSSTQPVGETRKLTLKPTMTLEGHAYDEPVIDGFPKRRQISFISYFPDGKRMVSASYDKTTRQWDLQTGKEIDEARDVCEQELREISLSRDGRWIATSSSIPNNFGKLEARNVRTRIVRKFEGDFNWIHCIDVSADNMLLVGGSWDGVRIWGMKTGKLMAGPFRVGARGGAHVRMVRFSQDSKKFAIMSETGRCLEVWDVQTQKLDVKVGESLRGTVINTPIFWTTKDKSIVAVFDFKDKESEPGRPFEFCDLKTIYEFNALTLEIVGAPFEGHTHTIYGLALSFDCALLASASHDNTIKLWAFESRQIIASFDQRIDLFIFSPKSYQLAYTNWGETNIYIYDLPPDILSNIRPAQEAQPTTTKNPDLLNSDATRRAARRNPTIVSVPRTLRPPSTIRPKQRLIRYLRKFLPFRSPPVREDEPRDPLDFPATSPLPRSLSAQAITQGRSDTDSRENSQSIPPLPITQSSATTTFKARLHHLSTWWPVRAGHTSSPIVHTPLAQAKERNAAADAPKKNQDIIPYEDYVPSRPPSPNPDSQQPSATAPITTGEHGSGKLCGCF